MSTQRLAPVQGSVEGVDTVVPSTSAVQPRPSIESSSDLSTSSDGVPEVWSGLLPCALSALSDLDHRRVRSQEHHLQQLRRLPLEAGGPGLCSQVDEILSSLENLQYQAECETNAIAEGVRAFQQMEKEEQEFVTPASSPPSDPQSSGREIHQTGAASLPPSPPPS